MSTTTEHTSHDAQGHGEHAEHEDHEEHGLSDWGYIKVAILLAILTGIEVLTYFVDFGGAAVPTLLILMVLKFLIVVAYFMHLKFDNSLFTRLFVTGLLLTMGVFAAVFTSFLFWNDPDGCRNTSFEQVCESE